MGEGLRWGLGKWGGRCSARLFLAAMALVVSIASGSEVRFALTDPPIVLLTGINASVGFDLLAAGIETGSELLIHVIEGADADAAARSASQLNNVVGELLVVVDSELTQVSGVVDIRVGASGSHDLIFLVTLGGNSTVLASDSITRLRSIPGVLCLLPTFFIIVVAIQSKNVVLALFMGLFVGGVLISPNYNPFLGFMRAGDTFLYGGLSGADQ
eukprot:2636015-Rhodomonas_salina.5